MTQSKKSAEIKLSPLEMFSATKLSLRLTWQASKKDLFIGLLNTTVSSITPTINAVLIGLLIDRTIQAVITQNAWPALHIMAALFVIGTISMALSQWASLMGQRANQDVVNYVDRLIATKYMNIPMEKRESKEFADMFERVRNYSRSIRWVYTGTISMVGRVIAFIAAFIAIFAISPWLAIVVASATVPYAILSFREAKKRQASWRQHSSNYRRSWKMLSLLLQPSASLELRLNGLERYFANKMIKDRNKDNEANLEIERKFFIPGLGLQIFGETVRYGALVYVILQVIAGKVAIGQLVAVNALLSQLSGAASGFFGYFANINTDLVNAKDFTTFMNMPELSDGHIELPVDEVPKIEFKNISFRYPNSDYQALQNVSFVVNPGEDIAIVGENGAGKTTIIKLLVGAYSPQCGDILISDIPIGEVKRESLLRHFGTLLQDHTNYDFATLSENVWFGDVTKKQDNSLINDTLERVDLGDLSSRLPKGLKQVLSKDLDEDLSADLSGGQWQRLALARGFFRDPNVLILDEPTSAIDAKAEYKIFQEIIKQQKDKTTVIISHRFSTVRKAKRIIVLDKGKIIESGTHAQLMKKSGLYHEMF